MSGRKPWSPLTWSDSPSIAASPNALVVSVVLFAFLGVYALDAFD